MQPVDVAERLYGFSLTYRSELTQSIQNPLLAVSILAAASSTLLPNFRVLAGQEGQVIAMAFYGSAIFLIAAAALSVILALRAISVGRYMTIKANALGESILTAQRNSAASVQRDHKLNLDLTEAFLHAAEHNEGVNGDRFLIRRVSVWCLYLAAAAFVVNVSAFLYGKWVG